MKREPMGFEDMTAKQYRDFWRARGSYWSRIRLFERGALTQAVRARRAIVQKANLTGFGADWYVLTIESAIEPRRALIE